jgi:hypothetical protein
MGLFGAIRPAGRVAEPAPPRPEAAVAKALRRGSLQLRTVDAGSLSGSEIELGSCLSPVCHGARLVASPRHAGGLLVT